MLTDAEIDSVTGPELDARVLVHVCGWRWMRNRHRGLCSLWPPAGRRGPWRQWWPTNFGPTTHEPFNGWPAEADRFADWEWSGVEKLRQRKAGRHGETVRQGIPRPSGNSEDAATLIEQLPKLVAVRRNVLGEWQARIQVRGLLYHGGGESMPLAVSRAALRWANAKEAKPC